MLIINKAKVSNDDMSMCKGNLWVKDLWAASHCPKCSASDTLFLFCIPLRESTCITVEGFVQDFMSYGQLAPDTVFHVSLAVGPNKEWFSKSWWVEQIKGPVYPVWTWLLRSYHQGKWYSTYTVDSGDGTLLTSTENIVRKNTFRRSSVPCLLYCKHSLGRKWKNHPSLVLKSLM